MSEVTRREFLTIVIGTTAVAIAAPAFPNAVEGPPYVESLGPVSLRFMTPEGAQVGEPIHIPPEAWSIQYGKAILNREIVFDAPGTGYFRIGVFLNGRYITDLNTMGNTHIPALAAGDIVHITGLSIA